MRTFKVTLRLAAWQLASSPYSSRCCDHLTATEVTYSLPFRPLNLPIACSLFLPGSAKHQVFYPLRSLEPSSLSPRRFGVGFNSNCPSPYPSVGSSPSLRCHSTGALSLCIPAKPPLRLLRNGTDINFIFSANQIVRLDFEHASSNEMFVNRGLLVLYLPIGRNSWCWLKGTRSCWRVCRMLVLLDDQWQMPVFTWRR